jgi:uncharacterized membrane protein YdbT with pleckstrin-like domain
VLSKETIWSRPFNAVRLQLESEAKSVFNRRRSSDIVIVTNRIIAGRLFYRLKHGVSAGKIFGKKSSRTVSYRNPRSMLFVFSILFSSAFSGGVYLFLLLYQSTDIIGETLGLRYSDIISGFTEFAQSLIDGISSTLVAIIVIIAGGWLYSFISNILRMQHYRLTMKSKYIEIKGGYFSRRNYHINRDYINYTDIRQNMVMKLFGLYSINIGCTGYGRLRGEVPVFIPITELPKGGVVMKMFLPGLDADTKPDVKKYKISKMEYLRICLIPIVIVIIFAVVFIYLMNKYAKFGRLYFFLLIMSEIPALFFMISCFFELSAGGISHNIDYRHFVLYSRKGLSLHMVIVPDEKVCTIRQRQSAIQKRNNSSDITIITCGEKGIKHPVKGVNGLNLDTL